jgi:hypothetical protein
LKVEGLTCFNNLNLESLHQPFYVLVFFFRDRVPKKASPGWLSTVILLISASWAAWITGVSHWHMALISSLLAALSRLYTTLHLCCPTTEHLPMAGELTAMVTSLLPELWLILNEQGKIRKLTHCPEGNDLHNLHALPSCQIYFCLPHILRSAF